MQNSVPNQEALSHEKTYNYLTDLDRLDAIMNACWLEVCYAPFAKSAKKGEKSEVPSHNN